MTYAPPASDLPTPKVLALTSPWSAFHTWRLGSGTGVGSDVTAPTANQAIYVPIVVTTTATFTRGFWYNGATATNVGNVCVALYTPDGTRQATTGAVAASGNSVIQSAAFSANYTAAPGNYYMGISYSIAGATGCFAFSSTVQYRMMGAYTEAVGSHPLPATATFATWSAFVMPYFGIAQTGFAI